ncbi:MAG: DUF234 domain-containing protein [Lachnospiraceae bacterium]|nr:DUF234 domain-containing protein [Lachnospiraceae bacterium]
MLDEANAQTLAVLRRYADGDSNAAVICYGSSYIERTSLIRAFLRGRTVFTYTACCVSDREQRRRLAAELGARGGSLPEDPDYLSIFERISASLSGDGRLVVLLDHFEHFFYERNSFLKALFSWLDNPACAGRIFVLLLSDAEVWVENAFVSRAGAEASKISGFVKLRESRFLTLRKSFPTLSMRDAVCLYSVFGGETVLWESYRPERSFRENICTLFLEQEHPFFRNLPMERLKELVREPAIYATILANLASGNEKLNDLFHATRIPRAKLSVYMKTLMAPGYVEKVFSYGTEGTARTKKGVYRISNAFFRFFYTCIYPHESALWGMAADKAYDLYLVPTLSSPANVAFRRICTEYIERLNEQERLPFAIEDMGEWNGKAGIIDMVAESGTGEALIGMCAYDRVLTEEDYHFLMQYAGQAGFHADYCYLFSGAGFGAELAAAAKHVSGLRLIGLEELAHG